MFSIVWIVIFMFVPVDKLRSRARAMIANSGRNGLTGLGWITASQGLGLVIRLSSTLILTRMLVPEAYGLLGTAFAFLTALELVSDLGIQPALIRHPHGDRRDYLSTGWWLGLARGLLLGGIAAGLAYPAADFYQEPELGPVLLVLALRPILMSLRSPMLPVWRRNVDYRSIFFEETVQTVVGTVCSILFAIVDPTVWAIVLGTLAGSVASTIATFVISPMLPGRMHRHCIRELATFGGQILVNTAMMALWMNLDRIAGLKLLSAADMGLFAIAYNLAAAAEGFVNRACDVHFSLLSRCETEEDQARWHTRITRLTAQWACPLLAIGVLIAPWVIDLLYDVRYHGAGVLLSILLARLMIRTFGQVQFQWLLARAQINFATISYLVAFITQAILIVPMCLNFGIIGLALSTLISTIVLTMTQAIIIHERVQRGLGDLWLSVCWTSVPLIALLAFLLS